MTIIPSVRPFIVAAVVILFALIERRKRRRAVRAVDASQQAWRRINGYLCGVGAGVLLVTYALFSLINRPDILAVVLPLVLGWVATTTLSVWAREVAERLYVGPLVTGVVATALFALADWAGFLPAAARAHGRLYWLIGIVLGVVVELALSAVQRRRPGSAENNNGRSPIDGAGSSAVTKGR